MISGGMMDMVGSTRRGLSNLRGKVIKLETNMIDVKMNVGPPITNFFHLVRYSITSFASSA